MKNNWCKIFDIQDYQVLCYIGFDEFDDEYFVIYALNIDEKRIEGKYRFKSLTQRDNYFNEVTEEHHLKNCETLINAVTTKYGLI